jgi:sugar phosphate isomerase/epimerase
MNSHPIVISLSSYGAAEVKRHGQAWFVNLVKGSGAGGVEIRSELLVGHEAELEQIAQQCSAIHVIYSCAEPLFSPEGTLEVAAFDRAMHDAKTIGAGIVKFSIGGGANATGEQMQSLAERLHGKALALLVENDQSNAAGSIFQLKRFFRKASENGLDLGMTFDIGNWHWVGECPQAAAVEFADRIRYVHTKGVLKQANRWIAVPITESQAPWKSLLDAMPAGCPWAIEFPLVGDDLAGVTHREVRRLKEIRGERYVD